MVGFWKRRHPDDTSEPDVTRNDWYGRLLQSNAKRVRVTGPTDASCICGDWLGAVLSVTAEDPQFPVAQAFRQLGRSIRTGEPVDPDFGTAARLHRILAAIERASDEKCWVTVDLP